MPLLDSLRYVPQQECWKRLDHVFREWFAKPKKLDTTIPFEFMTLSKGIQIYLTGG